MPYISEEERAELDSKIYDLSQAILNIQSGLVNPRDFSHFLGRWIGCKLDVQVSSDGCKLVVNVNVKVKVLV